MELISEFEYLTKVTKSSNLCQNVNWKRDIN